MRPPTGAASRGANDAAGVRRAAGTVLELDELEAAATEQRRGRPAAEPGPLHGSRATVARLVEADVAGDAAGDHGAAVRAAARERQPVSVATLQDRVMAVAVVDAALARAALLRAAAAPEERNAHCQQEGCPHGG